ncbi:GNAT family N-acetyltransferase [bacterium]|nr:GNAT family N-acetyltransferase [bacterium]
MKEVTSDNITIRSASRDDAATLAELSYRTFEETFAHLNSSENMQEYFSRNCTIDVLEEELKDTFSAFLIADCDQEPIGFAKLRWSEIPKELAGQNVIEIQRLYVLKKMIGKKVGRMLIKECFDIARRKKFDTVWLGVWERNERAISFYKQFGFEVFGAQIFELGRDKQTDLLMKKIL